MSSKSSVQNLRLPFLVDSKFNEGIHRGCVQKHLRTLLEHLEYRFPDVKIIEAFSIFDVKAIPADPAKRQEYGKENLEVLNAHYGPQNVIVPVS